MRVAWKPRTINPSVASFRYRVALPIELLRSLGHQAELFDPSQRESYDVVVFSKAYRPADQQLAADISRSGARVMLDLCDNHFYNPYGLDAYASARADMLSMIKACDVICSTPALARVVMAEAGLEFLPRIVGDLIEEIGAPSAPAAPKGLPRLVWFGLHGSPNAPSGMADLLTVSAQLQWASTKWDFELVVVSNSREKFEDCVSPLPLRTRYVEWERSAFQTELYGASAVLIPLSDNPFVACKTHNRLTLALAAGLPVLGDRIESYQEFAPYVWLSDWKAGLEAVLRPEREEIRRRITLGRAYLAAHWSDADIARQWEQALGMARQRSDRASVRDAPEGCLTFSADRRFVGYVDPEGGTAAQTVELMINGAAVARAPADLPCYITREDGRRRMSAAGGFVISPSWEKGGGDSILFRCSLRSAETGAPIKGTLIDVHQPW